MIAVVVLFAAASYTRFYFMMTAGERVVTDLRRAVFDHILSLDASSRRSAPATWCHGLRRTLRSCSR